MFLWDIDSAALQDRSNHKLSLRASPMSTAGQDSIVVRMSKTVSSARPEVLMVNDTPAGLYLGIIKSTMSIQNLSGTGPQL